MSETEPTVFDTQEQEQVVDYDLTTSELPSDLIRLYMTEIGRTPLLKAEQEVELAKEIEAGVFAQEQLDIVPEEDMDPVYRLELIELARIGQQSFELFYTANLRLVVSVAKKYIPRKGTMGFEDLIAEGNIGLMRAVKKFDYTKGFKFSTYATWWIRQAISRAIADQSQAIRMPVHMFDDTTKVRRVTRQLQSDLERDPTIEEIAEAAEMTPGAVEVVMGHMATQNILSLETPMRQEDHDKSVLGDVVYDTGSEQQLDDALDRVIRDSVEELMSKILADEREREIIRLRFGFAGRILTLDEVGSKYGLTRERIRQIETRAIGRLAIDTQFQSLAKDLLDIDVDTLAILEKYREGKIKKNKKKQDKRRRKNG